ncbi:MAG TPA: copper-binding protein [Bryobacteraceae bacterium]|jgi:protein SCO1/2|nr:copper-binding protein [Bryobacteraceae bacterium]
MPASNRFALAALALTLALGSCARPAPDNSKAEIKQYPIHGEIAGLDPGQHVATIKHDEIPGLMGAMTMGYPVKDPAEFGKLTVGETFDATVYVQGDDLWVGGIHKTKP